LLKGVGGSNILITLHSAYQPDVKVFIKANETSISDFPENWKLDLAESPKIARPPLFSFSFIAIFFKVVSYVMLGVILTLGVANTLDVLQVRIVATGSMIPAIDPGDMVIGVNPAFRSAVVNDVVIYQARRFDNEEVAKFAHRIIGGDSISGFILKGDNNPEPDIQSVMPEDISSVIVVTIPKVGMVLNPQMIIYALMALVAMFIAWEFLRSED
jgi:signal peptidase I